MPSVVAPAWSGRVPDHAVRGPDPSAPARLSAARAPSLLNLAALACWRCPLEVYSTIRARSPRGRSVPAAGADHASFFQTYHELRRARDCGELPDRDRTRAEEPPEKTRPAADDDDDDPFGPPWREPNRAVPSRLRSVGARRGPEQSSIRTDERPGSAATRRSPRCREKAGPSRRCRRGRGFWPSASTATSSRAPAFC